MEGTSKLILGASIFMVLGLAILFLLILLFLADLYSSPPNNPTSAANAPTCTQVPPSLRSFYAHGVLRPPRSFFFPTAEYNDDVERRRGQLHQLLSRQTAGESAGGSPSNSLKPYNTAVSLSAEDHAEIVAGLYDGQDQHLVYISNPIYGSDADDADMGALGGVVAAMTPPLTPMGELQAAKECSIELGEARSLGLSRSESNSQNAAFSRSSSSTTPSNW